MTFSRVLKSLPCIAALVAAGCAKEQPPIDRVQPDYFDKTFFVGKDIKSESDNPEFYSQATLVDVGYGASQDGLFTSTYAQPLTRIRWTITENLLIARLSYERIANSDGKGVGKATNDGIVVAAYAISKHFDKKRDYNPSTGEQTNVIDENASDRPWNERQYMRVDWSKNLSTDNYEFDTLSQLGAYGGITYEPLAYYVNDVNHPDAPLFVPGEGYLDVTNKAWAKPQTIDLSMFGMGSIPTCWFDADMGGNAPVASCAPTEITVRQSFRKVVENDYEPADWDGHRFQAFGAFTTERMGYARNYGMTDTQWHRFINRYDIWERNHFYSDAAKMAGAVACFTPETTPSGSSPHRDLDADGTEDECKSVGRGSRCDTFKQRCTLPYRDRAPKALAWFYSNDSHPDFFDATREATNEWDVAIRSSVMTARYAECVRTGGQNCAQEFPVYTGQQDDNHDAIQLTREVDDCRAGLAYAGQDCTKLAETLGATRGYQPGVIALAKMEELIVLCHSPVEAKDPAACGTPRLPADVTAAACDKARTDGDAKLINTCASAKNVRRGDIRYHQVNAIRTPQSPSPWGIMVDSNDPLTGETIAASINVWTHVNDLWSQGVVDMARYAKGELKTSDVTEGTYVRNWAEASEAATQNGSLPKFNSEQLKTFMTNLSGHTERPQYTLSDEARVKLREAKRQTAAFKFDALAPSANKPLYEQRRKQALNSRTEAELTTKMMQSLAGPQSKLGTDVELHFTSPFRGANPSVARDIYNRKEIALAEQGACILNEAPAPFALADLSTHLEEKFGRFNAGESASVQLDRAGKMQKYLAQRAHYAVVTHEMGHSIGLRHNFVSSSDAFNYRPQYWQLRTDNGARTNVCTDLDPRGNCIGPRYLDPVNPGEQKNLISMFMQSSTMDYAGEAAQDLLGLGAYDFAATRMFYGDVVSVFADNSYQSQANRGKGAVEKLDNFGGILGFQFSIGDPSEQGGMRDIHYSELQQNFELMWDPLESTCRHASLSIL